MATIVILYIVHHIALAVGLASSLVVDTFIIVVEKMKRIRSIEKSIVNRVLSYSFISAVIVFLIQLSQVFFLILTSDSATQDARLFGFSSLTTGLSACLLFSVAVQKYYQIKILYRYQEKHEHLSTSFIKHHKELSYTALLSVALWIAIYICYLVV